MRSGFRSALLMFVRFALLAVIAFLLLAVVIALATESTGAAEKAVIAAVGIGLALAASRVRRLGQPHPH